MAAVPGTYPVDGTVVDAETAGAGVSGVWGSGRALMM